MKQWLIGLGVVALLGLLAACGGKEEDPGPVPTLINLDANATEMALTFVPAATGTSRIPTLAPSFTPSATFTVTPTATPTLPTATPEGFNPLGLIYFIYNGDSIVRARADGQSSELIITFGVGMLIRDMSLSPSGDYLAFVAPGNGSANEVYVASLDGSYVQRVSCLGFNDVRAPAWSPDSRELAFFATQAPGDPLNIFITAIEGSGNCPVENNQRQIGELNSTTLHDLVWDPTQPRLFFSDGPIFAINATSGEVSDALTPTSGFGPDHNLIFNPVAPNQLTYLRSERDISTNTSGGQAYRIDVAFTTSQPTPEPLPSGLTRSIAWSNDGHLLLSSGDTSISVFDTQRASARNLLGGLLIQPRATFSPDAARIAYVGQDPTNAAVQQVFVYDIDADTRAQVTSHPEGTVADLIWLPPAGTP